MNEVLTKTQNILDANNIDLFNRLNACKQTPLINPETIPFTITTLSFRPDQEIIVVRDDFLCGGAKSRFSFSFLKKKIKQGYREFVYVSPWYGAAAIALGWCLKVITQETGLELKSTVYIDEYLLKELPPYLQIAKMYGVNVIQIPLNQKKFDIAYEYCKRTGALFIKPGFNHPEVIDKIAELTQIIKQEYGIFDEVFSAIGSGTLIRGLQKANLGKQYIGIYIFGNLPDIGNAHGIYHYQDFSTPVNLEDAPPFRSAMYYDTKVWQYIKNRPGKILFWNVA